MNCPECSSPLEKDAKFCPKCYARIPAPSLWQRFVSLFSSALTTPKPAITIKKSVNIKTTDAAGHHHEYHSLEALPPELRAEIEKLQSNQGKQALTASSSPDGLFTELVSKKTISVIRVKDPSGTERTYHSIEELPPQIREALEKSRKQLEQ